MKQYMVTPAAVAAIHGVAGGSLEQTARQRPDGNYDVELSDDTMRRLMEFALPGETLSDVIVRLVATVWRRAH